MPVKKYKRRYKKKPPIIEAIKYTGMDNVLEVCVFAGCNLEKSIVAEYLLVPSSAGYRVANVGDYIYKDTNGRCFPCKSRVFENMYKEVGEKEDTKTANCFNIEKILKNMVRNKNRPDLHSFCAKTKDGSVFVVYANERFYINYFITKEDGQDVEDIICNSVQECYNKLAELGIKPETIEM